MEPIETHRNMDLLNEFMGRTVASQNENEPEYSDELERYYCFEID